MADQSTTSTSGRYPTRANSDTSHISVSESISTENSTAEPPRKRSRDSVDSTQGGTRKSVTVTVKANGIEEFHTNSVVATPAKDGLGPDPPNTQSPSLSTLPKDAPDTDKVLAVINFLRDRRRRPDEKVVIDYSQRKVKMSPAETLAALEQLVIDGRIHRVQYPSGVSYRYHLSVVARGDSQNSPPAKPRSRQAANAPKSNGSSASGSKLAVNKGGFLDPKNSTLSGIEMQSLTSLVRLLYPGNGIIKPTTLTPSGDAPALEKPQGNFLSNLLGGVSQSMPGVSNYDLPPPTPCTMGTLAKVLGCLAHATSTTGSSSNDSTTSVRQNGHRGSRSKNQMFSADYASIIVRKRPAEAFVELSIRSPGSTLRNAFTLQVLGELRKAFEKAITDPETRVILLTGVGSIFSSGIDLSLLVTASATFVDSLIAVMRDFLLTLATCPKLVVAGVNGPAAGLGVALLPLCDLVYASDTATFRAPYAALGQVPEAGASITLARKVGTPLANDLLLASRRLTAREALQRGLVSDVLFPKNFAQEMLLRCARVASQSAAALEVTKRFSSMHDREQLEMMINAECQQLGGIWKTPEFRVTAANYVQNCMNDFL